MSVCLAAGPGPTVAPLCTHMCVRACACGAHPGLTPAWFRPNASRTEPGSEPMCFPGATLSPAPQPPPTLLQPPMAASLPHWMWVCQPLPKLGGGPGGRVLALLPEDGSEEAREQRNAGPLLPAALLGARGTLRLAIPPSATPPCPYHPSTPMITHHHPSAPHHPSSTPSPLSHSLHRPSWLLMPSPLPPLCSQRKEPGTLAAPFVPRSAPPSL